MKLTYTSIKEDSKLVLTDFNCAPSQQMLSDKGMYKVLWAKDASRDIVIDGYTLRLEKGQLIFCTPLNVLEITQSDGLLALVFNREFYCIREHDEEVSCNGFLFYGSSQPPVITLSDKELKSYDAMFLMIQEEFETRDHIQGEMLRVLLKRLLITSSRHIKSQLPEPEMPSNQFDLVRQYHILVEQHFRTLHKVSDYAELLFKSPKTLSNHFKNMGDASPLKVINDRIILEAKRLLLYSDKNVEEVSNDIGFNDAGHFSKFFKKHTGVPPGTFKKAKSPL
ncbi:helix-turn-helix domain-containing protein [Dokdonia sp. Asnod1-B02]|jgi:AraC-like DNA-binding protein|uniref:helix-turn-helix domain-containing protein n=1 Tax=Dokdonia sp. Asnod1-B02 TaxID=3160573 RepID=UPI00386F904F